MNKKNNSSDTMRSMQAEFLKKNGYVPSDEEVLKIVNEEIQKVRQEMRNENKIRNGEEHEI